MSNRKRIKDLGEDGPVFFYGHRSGTFAAFSNFYPASFELDSKVWPTSEHYFMAQKTTDKKVQEKIRKAKNAYEAKKMGRKVELRSNWDNIKFAIMYQACLAKFDQNPTLKELLLSTGDRKIHENCNDPWWGGGPNYPSGRDWLGKVLMQVRDYLAK